MRSITAVIGMGFGDEGKGLVTDFLCSKSKSSLVVRFSGGQQAGHGVILDDKRHVFSCFGSGTLRDVPTYWTAHCTFSPIHAMREYKELGKMHVYPTLFIDHRCPVTTPYEIAFNHSSLSYKENGTCGRGVGATWERESKYYSLLVGDLIYPNVYKTKLSMLKKYYADLKISDLELNEFEEAVNFTLDHFVITDATHFVSSYSYCEDVVYEGSQGLLLDQNIGFFPYVCRGKTDATNIIDSDPEIFFVTRGYQTRHGNGPMTTSDIPHKIKRGETEINTYNTWQGEFRIGLLDIDLLRYAFNRCTKSRNNNIVITCLDHITNDYRLVCDGKIIECSDEDDFIRTVSNKIGPFRRTYISKTPESKNIEEFHCSPRVL